MNYDVSLAFVVLSAPDRKVQENIDLLRDSAKKVVRQLRGGGITAGPLRRKSFS